MGSDAQTNGKLLHKQGRDVMKKVFLERLIRQKCSRQTDTERKNSPGGRLQKAEECAEITSKPHCQGRIRVILHPNERKERRQKWPRTTSRGKHQPGSAEGGGRSAGLTAGWEVDRQVSKQLRTRPSPF